MRVRFDSAADLAEVLRCVVVACGRHEAQIGHLDPDWLGWYAQYMVQEQVGHPGLARRGAGA
jgi:hypothetical protein